MTGSLPAAFTEALTGAAPPAAWAPPLAALWWLAQGPPEPGSTAWRRAHALVQEEPGRDAAWVHAHLHRIEGDAGNARYWYGRAGREEPRAPAAEERATIVSALLDPA